MKCKFLLVAFLAAGLVWGQSGPNSNYVLGPITAPTAGATINWQSVAIGFHQIVWTVSGTISSCTVALDSSADGVSFSAGGIIAGQTCTSNGSSVVTGANFAFGRINVTALSGGGTLTVIYIGWITQPGGYQVTQPVSVVSLPLPANAAQETGGNLATLAGAVSGGKVQVSGTFWQTTQPVSGTFWQTTQPVSGTFWQATQPVSGTFWQATQPIIGTLSDNGAAANNNRSATLPGVYQTTPGNGTPGTQGRDAAQGVSTEGILWTGNLPVRRPASYVASKYFAASSTTDNAVLPGNATNDVLVTRVKVSCTQTTAGIIHLEVIKRSAADTSGTSAAITVVPDDSGSTSSTSAPLSYTGTGPSVGTAIGDVDNYQLGCNAAATPGPNDIYILNRTQKPITLIGVAQELAINFGGAITGGNITVTFEWIEVAHMTP